jgi:hypothetical protein
MASGHVSRAYRPNTWQLLARPGAVHMAAKQKFIDWEAQHGQKLYCNFNNIRVRSFILSGAPNCHHSEQNCEPMTARMPSMSVGFRMAKASTLCRDGA